MRLALLAALALLAFAPAAAAGGWATVGIAPLPAGTEPGGTWTPTLTILQHGKTPLEGVRPSITIRNAHTGETQTVAARPAGRPGVYAAAVTFPAAGTWTFTVDDGFSRVHTFAPVEIAAAGAGTGRRAPFWLLGAAALAVALGTVLTRRALSARVRATLPARSG